MAEHENRGGELILANGEQATLQDTTQGTIHLYVGPTQKNLDKTDRPVRWDVSQERFIPCDLLRSITLFAKANEGEYLVLNNPTADNNHRVPEKGKNQATPQLDMGRKINIPGPVQIPLWPGQSANAIPGHALCTDEYVLCCVYNQEAAERNWDEAVVDAATTEGGDDGEDKSKKKEESTSLKRPTSLAIGKTFHVTGNEAAFYMPPTGIEVVPTDEDGEECYVRRAVTLERLQYCALLSESGDKRYVKGPKVVFPEPTETFVRQDNGEIVASAIELNHLMALYIKVTADYKDGDGEHEAGDELFIKGRSNEKTLIYYPIPEHAIIRYGKEKVHYAVAVPEGEARYIMDRDTGEITTEKGPQMLLPDPRKSIIVRRILSPKMVRLLYPDNSEAATYNSRLTGLAGSEGQRGPSGSKGFAGYAAEETVRNHLSLDSIEDDSFAAEEHLEANYSARSMLSKSASPRGKKSRRAGAEFVGDSVERSKTFTKPRTITLNSKYGAVDVNVWNGYAIMVTDKQGNRRVEVGPKGILLDYDEEVEAMALSTGKPKTTDHLFETAYLRVLHNKVSDIILDCETADFCHVELKLSYRVNFEEEGETEEERAESRKRWFDVENYVKFMCDHLRSKIKNMIKSKSIEKFHADSINFVRNCVLGESSEAGRPGQSFENGMRVYDVEVLKVTIGDQDIASLLVDEQHAVVKQGLQLKSEERRLALKTQQADIQRQISQLDADTSKQDLQLETEEAERQHVFEVSKVDKSTTLREQRDADKIAAESTRDATDAAQLARDKARADQKDDEAKLHLENLIKEAQASTKSAVEKAKAFTPEIVACLNQFSSRQLAIEACKSLAPIALVHGENVTNVFDRLVDGVILDGHGMRDLQKIAGNLKQQHGLPQDDSNPDE